MTIHLGNVDANSTLYIPFASYDSSGASVTLTGLAVTDIEIYKDGSTTQRASDNGYALLDTDGIDFDGITGIHGFSIDLSDNTTSGFYAAGSFYWVVVSAVTIDSQTVNFIAATFRIGPAAVNVTQFGGTAGTFSSGRPEVNTTHAAGTAWGSGAITAASIASDAITAAKVAADVGTEIGTAVWATATRSLTVIDEDSTTLDLDATIRSAVGLASANLDTQISTLATAVNLATVAGYLDTEIAAILADTNELQTDWANGGRLDLILDGRASQASVDTIDTVVDAIKAKTDSLTFTQAGVVDANIQYVNDVQVNGTGASGDEWGP